MNHKLNEKLDEKSLKLLADPHKLKVKKKFFIQYDHLKYQLESKFNCKIRDDLYTRLLTIIETEIIIDSILQDIINQVDLNHSP